MEPSATALGEVNFVKHTRAFCVFQYVMCMF